MINALKNKIDEVFGSPIGEVSGVTGRRILKWDSISDLMPYESYDEEKEIYINSRSLGCVFEVSIFTGLTKAMENEFASLFQSIMLPGYNIQILMAATPKINDRIEKWEKENNKDCGSEVIRELNKGRANYLKSLGLKQDEQQALRDFKLIISVSKENAKPDELDILEACEIKEQVSSVFETAGSTVRVMAPTELIRFLDEYMNGYKGIESSEKEWNKYEPIGEQIVDRSNLYEISDEGVLINNEQEIRSYSVIKFPRTWSINGMGKMMGDAIREVAKLPCPFVTQLGVHICDSKGLKAGMLAKASRVEAQAGSPLGKIIPSLRKEADEWGFVRDQFDKGERLVKLHYQVVLLERKELMTKAEAKLELIYKGNGWSVQRDHYIGLPSIVSTWPMMWGEGSYRDMHYLKRTKTALSYEPVNMMPIQAEWKGTSTPGIMLTGRRGQLFYWYPFDNKDGNFNVSIAGGPGKGKSFFMQEVTKSTLSLGGRVYVLDMGRSFEKQVKRFEGEYLEFSTKSNIVLNPFSTINANKEDAVSDSLDLMKPVISMMIAPKAGTNDFEDVLIEKALIEVWKAKGVNAGIGDIARWFKARKENRDLCQRIGEMLYSYTEDGVYGKHFNGKANINLDSRYCVVELEELKNKPSLQAVVLQILIVTITNKVILGDRKYLSSIVFDEAWNMLTGKKTAEFMDKLARTLRKYNGSLIAGTQNLEDFYKNDGSKAVFMNSDWLIMFAQKKESIEQLKNAGKFEIDEASQRVMETIRTQQGKYSEFMIIHESGSSVGRFIADPYTKILYSSKAEEFEAVESLVASGMDMGDAIREVSERVYGKG